MMQTTIMISTRVNPAAARRRPRWVTGWESAAAGGAAVTDRRGCTLESNKAIIRSTILAPFTVIGRPRVGPLHRAARLSHLARGIALLSPTGRKDGARRLHSPRLARSISGQGALTAAGMRLGEIGPALAGPGTGPDRHPAPGSTSRDLRTGARSSLQDATACILQSAAGPAAGGLHGRSGAAIGISDERAG